MTSLKISTPEIWKIVVSLVANCLSVFVHFVKLALKGLKFELGNFETYYFRLWPEGQRSPYDSSEHSSDATDDSGIDFPDLSFVVFSL